MDQLTLVCEASTNLTGPSFVYAIDERTVIIRQQNKLLQFDLVKRQANKQLIIMSLDDKQEQIYNGNPCGVYNNEFYEIIGEQVIQVNLKTMQQHSEPQNTYALPLPLSGYFMPVGNCILIQNSGVIMAMFLENLSSYILCQLSDQNAIPSEDYVFYIRNEQQLCSIKGNQIRVHDTINNVTLIGGQVSSSPYHVRALDGSKSVITFQETSTGEHQISFCQTDSQNDTVIYKLKNSCKKCTPYLTDDILLIVDQQGCLLALKNEKLAQASAISNRLVFTSKQKLSLAGHKIEIPEPAVEKEEPKPEQVVSPINSPLQKDEIKRLEEEENELDKEAIELQKQLEDVDRMEKEEEEKDNELQKNNPVDEQKHKERLDKMHKESEARREQIQMRLRHVELRKKEIQKRVCGPTFQDKVRFFSGQ